MKGKFFLLLSLLFITVSCGTYKELSTQEYVKVIEDLNTSQNELFVKANDWLITIFNDATSIIEYSDKVEGTLIGKYLLHGQVFHRAYGVTFDTRIFAKIDIRVRDNKARISIQPLGTWKYDPSGMTIYDYSEDMARKDIQNLASSFHEALLKEGVKF